MNPENSHSLSDIRTCGGLAVGQRLAAQGKGDIMVDVVVDMTDAGAKIVHPTPASPAYYLPLPIGYKPMGGMVAEPQIPPPTPEVEHMMAVALAEQGYLVMTKTSLPSLVLSLWWGYMAPEINSTAIAAPTSSTNGDINRSKLPMFGGNPGTGMGSGMSDGLASALAAQLPTDQMFNNDQMMSLVAGSADSFQYSFQNAGLIYEQVRTLARSPRHYLLVSAFDFKDWLHHKSTLLWRAHISTELWGHSLAQVLPTMIATGAPMFGRETNRPRLIHVPLLRPPVPGLGGRS